ncbi:thioesterase [Terrimonas sp.]|uniref:acyl-CoA thioesterase n=1 Tax=Terrimonas sp. TaxID=1914338 RepID=UPI000D5105CC|nr:thioesterase family protein [Terrimonas sp.]PVD51875.1 thioesterase [Terrimonas sp.]
MDVYKKSPEVRWADLDPNFHMLHSRYYDLGAYVRMCFLTEHGLNLQVMAEHQMGPILFREECVFKREIKFGDKLDITLHMLKARKDGSRWTMQHHIYINDETLAAVITVDGAWIHTERRRLATPPPHFAEVFYRIPRGEGFEWQ